MESGHDVMRPKISFVEFETLAQGGIEAKAEQQERLEEFTDDILRGEFHIELRWDESRGKMILVRCVDGRTPEEIQPFGPNSAGGTESLFVADDLTTKRFAAEDGSTAGGYTNLLTYLIENGYAVGGHTGEHAKESETSDCGANDKLGLIYGFMVQNGDAIRDFAKKHLKIEVPEKTHELIIGNAAARTNFSSGSDILAILKEAATDGFYDDLKGGHKEVIATINTTPDTTLDRNKIKEKYGLDYQAFNVDAWAFPAAADAISLTVDEIDKKVAALTYYNLATALVLSGPKMRVGITQFEKAA